MTKFLILHGTAASPSDNWFMWLKGKLVGEGYKVWLPQLPHAEQPNPETYNTFLLADKDFTIDSDTVLIGHSSGAVAILRLLEQLPETTAVKAAILVSAFEDDLGWDSLKDLFREPLDFDRISSRCDTFIFLHSDNDPHVPLEHAEHLSNRLNAKLVIMEGQGHFNIETGSQYKQFPELLEIIKSIE